MSDNYYGFDLDVVLDELFDHLESVQDGKSGHTVAFKGENKEAVAKRMGNILEGFCFEQMYKCDENGTEIK